MHLVALLAGRFRDAVPSKNLGGAVIMYDFPLPPAVGIGLTDLPKMGAGGRARAGGRWARRGRRAQRLEQRRARHAVIGRGATGAHDVCRAVPPPTGDLLLQELRI